MKKFTAVFLALVVCFSLVFSFPVSRVSAEKINIPHLHPDLQGHFTVNLTDSSKYNEAYLYNNYVSEKFYDDALQKGKEYLEKYNYCSDYVYLVCSNICDNEYKLVNSATDEYQWDLAGVEIYFYFFFSDHDFTCTITDRSTSEFLLTPDVSDVRGFTISAYYNSVTDTMSYRYGTGNTSLYSSYLIKQYLFGVPYSNYQKSELKFSLLPELSENMDLNQIDTYLNVSVENPTDKSYDYMFYVSKSPASIGLTNSLYDTTFVSSSNQWAYVKQYSSSIPPDKKELLKDKINDRFTTTDILDILSGGFYVGYNVWGGVFDASKEFMSYSDDSYSFYSLCQTNCPIYLINSKDDKMHNIPFSRFNVNPTDTFYFNIIYKEHSEEIVGAVGHSASALVGAGTGQYTYPVFDSSSLSDYISYDSIPFSFAEASVQSNDNTDITSYQNLIYYSNPDHSSAYITNDNSVNINNSFNRPGSSDNPGFDYDSSCPVNYINYGTIYHGCTIYNSPSGVILPGGSSGSGSSVSAPDLPEADFKKLYDESGDFFKFFKDLIESSGFLPVTIFSSACIVALFMRIWGR